MNTKDPEAVRVRAEVEKIALAQEYVEQLHGFFLNVKERYMRFDLVISFDTKDRWAVYQKTVEEVQKQFPDYSLEVVMDSDFA